MKSRRISIVLREPLLSKLEFIESSIDKAEFANLGEYLVTCLQMLHEDESDYPEQINTDELAQILFDESRSAMNQAKLAAMKGNRRGYVSKMLKSASLELEALSLLEDPKPKTLISSTLIILANIKEALGFKKLPEV